MKWFSVIFTLIFCQTTDTKDEITLCKTLNREPGICVPLYWCPHLLQALASFKSSVIEYYEHEQKQCEDHKVCCGKWTIVDGFNYINPISYEKSPPYVIPEKLHEFVTSNRNYVKKHLLPDTTYCGFQQADDRISAADSTELDEFPWLVAFKVSSVIQVTGRQYTSCAGVLISSRHILTSNYCGPKRSNVHSVILGLFDQNKNATCREDPFFPECTDLAVEIAIKEPLALGNTNLLLYTLKKDVTYSDYIRPICLPLHQPMRPKPRDVLEISIWQDYTKRRLSATLLPLKECNVSLDLSPTIGHVNKQYAMCSSTTTANSYRQMNGGAFTYKHKHQWFLEGIINGYAEEGTTEYIIGERITPEILDWILDAMYYFHKHQ